MWVFFPNSFVSIVDKGDASGQTLLVRARRNGEIEAIFPDAEVIEGAGTDYRYRARIDREEVAKRVSDAIRGIRFSNFKATVKDHDRHDAYMGVWDVMYQYQEEH